jgi:peroxiredoxin
MSLSAFGCTPDEGNSRGARAPVPAAVVALGSTAPDFAARDIDGRSVTLSTHLHKDVVLLDFYSTWCEPCVTEFSHLRELYDTNKANGLVVIAISVDGPETAPNVSGFVRRNQLEFPMLIDADSRISSLYNPRRTAPLTVLIDRSGTVVAVHEGYVPGDEEQLATEVSQALHGPMVGGRPLARP